jgi:hypothetical protein
MSTKRVVFLNVRTSDVERAEIDKRWKEDTAAAEGSKKASQRNRPAAQDLEPATEHSRTERREL